MNQLERLDFLIDYLKSEPHASAVEHGQDTTFEGKLSDFRALCNMRPPNSVNEDYLQVQDAFLQRWNGERQFISIDMIEPVAPQLYLWQGDITTLQVDAIVNAANHEMLGCFKPNHQCIDNIIHTRAGVQLRLACHKLMEAQGRKEPTGRAKITDAYNLPAKKVIHTVGPFITQRGVTALSEQLLASAYTSCLKLADEQKLQSIAFCCISTGEFNFPNDHAAAIAIETVKTYLQETGSKIAVLFNVFTDEDDQIYQSYLLEKGD